MPADARDRAGGARPDGREGAAGGREDPADGPGLERLLTFLDAVVAIAVTLLVLPLVDLVPETASGEPVRELLAGHLGELFAFALSFVLIARLWYAQQDLLRGVAGRDRVVELLLLGWTFTIVVLPFPTALLAGSGDEAATKVLYLGTLAVSELLLAAVARALATRPGFRRPDVPVDPLPLTAAGATALVALALTLVFPVLGYWPLLLLTVDSRVARWLVRRSHRTPHNTARR